MTVSTCPVRVSRKRRVASRNSPERRGHGAVVGLARLGERERLVAALEERHAEELLERLDLAAHRRLREEELGARAW